MCLMSAVYLSKLWMVHKKTIEIVKKIKSINFIWKSWVNEKLRVTRWMWIKMNIYLIYYDVTLCCSTIYWQYKSVHKIIKKFNFLFSLLQTFEFNTISLIVLHVTYTEKWKVRKLFKYILIINVSNNKNKTKTIVTYLWQKRLVYFNVWYFYATT